MALFIYWQNGTHNSISSQLTTALHRVIVSELFLFVSVDWDLWLLLEPVAVGLEFFRVLQYTY